MDSSSKIITINSPRRRSPATRYLVAGHYLLPPSARGAHTSCLELLVAHQEALQVFGGNIHLEASPRVKGSAPLLFGDNDHLLAALLANTKCCRVPEPEGRRDIRILGDRQDTTGRSECFPRYNHCAVVQHAILEKDILDKARRDIGIHDFPGLLVKPHVDIPLHRY